MTKKQEQEAEEAAKYLRKILKPGNTVYTVLRHVSQSGMSRHISLVIVSKKDGLRDITWQAARVLGHRRDERDGGLKVSGCGMDMGFHIVYSLSRRLFPNGFGEKCRVKGCRFRPLTEKKAARCNDTLVAGVSEHEFWGRNGDNSIGF